MPNSLGCLLNRKVRSPVFVRYGIQTGLLSHLPSSSYGKHEIGTRSSLFLQMIKSSIICFRRINIVLWSHLFLIRLAVIFFYAR